MLARWHRRLCTPCFFAIVAGIVSSLVMSSLVVLPVRGQQSTAQDSRVIHAGRLFDAHSGKMLEGQDILVRGNRIEKVGPNLQVPSGAHEIDLRNATVLPGFIDVHTHLTSNPGDSGYSSLGISVPRQALTGARNAKLTLLAGFTAVRNVGAPGYSDVALRDAINDGDIVGPRMQVSGPPLGITGGHCDNSLLPFDFVTEDQLRERIQMAKYSDFQQYPQFEATFGDNAVSIFRQMKASQ